MKKYQNTIKKRGRPKIKWNQNEISLLKKLVIDYGEKWKLISEILKTKSNNQCMIKYREIKKKQKNLQSDKEEESKLRSSVNLHGTNNWSKCSLMLGTKSRTECERNWTQNVNATVKSRHFQQDQADIFEELKDNFNFRNKILENVVSNSNFTTKKFIFKSIKDLKESILFEFLTVILFHRRYRLEGKVFSMIDDFYPKIK